MVYRLYYGPRTPNLLSPKKIFVGLKVPTHQPAIRPPRWYPLQPPLYPWIDNLLNHLLPPTKNVLNISNQVLLGLGWWNPSGTLVENAVAED